MAKLTVTIDERVLKRARITAIEQGTSVNRVVTEYLQRWVGASQTQEALAGSSSLRRSRRQASRTGTRSFSRPRRPADAAS